jgi:predicted glycosyltransferase
MYSPDTIGLGHLRRHSSIASELVAQVPGINVVMLIGSGAGAFFELPSGVDSIKIPSVQKIGRNSWRARSLDLSSDVTRRIRAGLIREAVDSLKPDLLLVDHLPAGIWGELIPAFQQLKEQSPHTRIVLGLRDILDEPEQVRQRWHSDKIYDLIRKYYDSIFIYGDETIYPSAQHYGLGEHVCADVHYLGYIGSKTNKLNGSVQHVAHSLQEVSLRRTPGAKLMVVIGGGGHDAYPMMSSVMRGLISLNTATRPDTVFITGPLMPCELRVQLVEQASLIGALIVPWTHNVRDYLSAADLVVTMGGYNSLLETIASGKPTINIPRSGPSQEQTIRARLFDELGLVSYLSLDDANPAQVASAIEDNLNKGPRTEQMLSFDGASRAARRIKAMLRGPRYTWPEAAAAGETMIAV